MSESNLNKSLRRTLLLKVISHKESKPEDVNSVIELTSTEVVDLLSAQSMTFYLVEGNELVFKHVYYSPSLYQKDLEKKASFEAKKAKLLALRLPLNTGVVGRVIANEKPEFFHVGGAGADQMHNLSQATGFEVRSMLTVPLVAGKCVGAIQVLNKEPHSGSEIFDDEDLKALEEVAEYTAPLVRKLIDPDYKISDVVTAKYISRFTSTPLVTSEDELDIEEKLLELIEPSVIQRTGVFPLRQLSPRSVAALMVNPFDYPSQESFETTTDMQVDEVTVAPASLIDHLVDKYYAAAKQAEAMQGDMGDISGLVDVIGEEYGITGDADSEKFEEESAPIISLANRIVEDAYVQGASDIHVEPLENELLVRYRIDGVCQEKLRLPKAVSGALVARYKVMSELDIAEKRLPQDGRIVFKKFTKRNIDVDLRVATAPMNFGEKVVMRILDKTKSALPITSLGFSESNLTTYRELIRQPYGMILHCGPTGSGKSMTLFSALREIAKPDINIQTAEDPIEYTIPGINQMQMQKRIGLDFARALRSYLRMDPDIILVGEIRDRETAEISVEAALTGHLLLSTLHTNDAPSSVARFTDMGVEPFMISASLLVVCAQRLMRRVCKNCQKSYLPEGNELEVIRRALGANWTPHNIYRVNEGGCAKCGGVGMKGRVGIHELMRNTEDLTRAINEGRDTADLKRIAMADGMKTLHQDAVLKVSEGLSTLIEAVSTVPPDMIIHQSE